MKCFLDLDGVLVDFLGGVHKAHNLSYNIEEYPYPLGVWDIVPYTNISEEKFWEPTGYDFWVNLEIMSDAQAILNICEKMFGQQKICILTVPCLTTGSTEGKIRWVKNNLPQYSQQILAGNTKSFLASGDSVLIDDAEHNINVFENSGGTGVLVPRPWNRLHGVDPIAYLEERLSTLFIDT